MSSNRDTVSKLRGMLAKASQGRWTGDYDCDNVLMVEREDGSHWYIGRIEQETDEREDSRMDANFELVMTVVNELPFLLSEVQKLERVRDAYDHSKFDIADEDLERALEAMGEGES